MTTAFLRLTILALTALTAACQEHTRITHTPATDVITHSQPDVPATEPAKTAGINEHWLGKWTGPEGTGLVLSSKGDRYRVDIQSLDGPASYEGTPAGERIEFMRNGKAETIHAGNGKETGMKWLADKKECLIISEGEGFCRN